VGGQWAGGASAGSLAGGGLQGIAPDLWWQGLSLIPIAFRLVTNLTPGTLFILLMRCVTLITLSFLALFYSVLIRNS